MNREKLAGLKRTDFRKLCKLPDQEVIGEVIKLNHTIYQNSLDVLKICTIIRSRKKTTA